MNNPELGTSILANGIRTNVHDSGTGHPLMLLHGSGPGVSAWANWRLVMPTLAQAARVIAPDIVGFGYTDRPEGQVYAMDEWVKHAIGVLDALNIERTDLVGNSFGGALALALAIRHPQRIRRLVLMGASGIDFELTPGLDAVWGYTPSVENMRKLLDIFAYNQQLATDDLAKLRYEASIRPGVQEAYAQMFPAPRQRCIEAQANAEADLRNIQHETLVVHGREDAVIPVSNSIRLSQLIPRAQLHIYPQCGHWTQIEHAARFARLVADFVTEANQ